MKADKVSWMSPAVPRRSTAITGSAGRYMSIDSGVNDDSSASSTSRIGVSVGRALMGGGAAVVVIGVSIAYSVRLESAGRNMPCVISITSARVSDQLEALELPT